MNCDYATSPNYVAEKDIIIIGISGLYHDSAACLVRNGKIIVAVQEERFSRIKHDSSFPKRAIQYCIHHANISPESLTLAVYYEKPLLKFDRLIETYLRFAPRGLRSFFLAMGSFINEKLSVTKLIDRTLDNNYKGPILFLQHHQSHAASAFFPSPFEHAAIITADGVGEWTTTSIGIGRGNKIQILKEIHFPHSLGLLYSAFTYYIGFKVNSGEYKLMGLAPYGKPVFKQKILEHLIQINEDGSFKLNMKYFNYCYGLNMINKHFHKLFGGPPRYPEDPIEQRHIDIAASIQVITEEIMLKLAQNAYKATGETNLCLAGGVALNCVANGRILKEGPFKQIWIQPAAGDAGGAVGAALFAWYEILDNPRKTDERDSMAGSFLGPSYDDVHIQNFLDKQSIPYKYIDNDDKLYQDTTKYLIQQKVVGWFQGRMEFGPRSLGARSILADPRNPEMQSRVNLKIKFREGFRPFAPVVLQKKLQEYFDIDRESPYMLFVAPVTSNKRLTTKENEQTLHYLKRLHIKRSIIPSVTHVDFSARIQTCDEIRNPKLYRLLKIWEKETGCSVLLNTSFNIREEPIVCSPENAYNCFMSTDMDVLVLGNNVLLKEEQPNPNKLEEKNFKI